MTTASLTGPLEIGKASIMAQWDMVDADTVGAAAEFPDQTDAVVTITGTWGGATVVIEGSNDGSTFVTLTDPQGNAISKTTNNAVEQITEVPRYIRPSKSGGSSTTLRVMIKATGAKR